MARSALSPGVEPVPGYHLLEFIGRGGFGQVWKATGPGGIEVALKIIEDLGRKKGGKELRALRLLKGIRHPNLVQIMAFWCTDTAGNVIADEESSGRTTPTDGLGTRETLLVEPGQGGLAEELIIAMTLAEKSLWDRLQECRDSGARGIPKAELLDYLADAAKAIDHLNVRHDIQHCDIKPQNILIQSGVAQVGDFGLAKAIGDVRQTSMTAGTLAYGAPELLHGHGRPSQHTDQYSVAMSYYELGTGELPFAEESFQGVLVAKTAGRLDFAAVTPAEREVLARATSVDPAARYPSVSSFVRALRSCVPDAAPADDDPRTTPADDAVLARATDATAAPTEPVIDREPILSPAADTLPSGVPALPALTQPAAERRPGVRWRVWAAGVVLVGVVALLAAAWGRAIHFDDRVRSLALAGKQAEANELVAGVPRWYGWFVDLAALQALAGRPRQLPSDLKGHLHNGPATTQADAVRPVDLALEVAENRIPRAQQQLADDPAACVELCDYGLRALNSVPAVSQLSDAQRSRVQSLRYQLHLLRARAGSRADPPVWNDVYTDLEKLDYLRGDGFRESPSQRALRETLGVVAERGQMTREAFDVDVLVNRLVRSAEALRAASATQDAWYPDPAESKLRDAVAAETAERLRQLIAAADTQPVVGVSLCDKLLSFRPDDRDTKLDRAQFLVGWPDYRRSIAALDEVLPAADPLLAKYIQDERDVLAALLMIEAATEDSRLEDVVAAFQKAVVALRQPSALWEDAAPALRLQLGEVVLELLRRDKRFRQTAFMADLDSLFATFDATERATALREDLLAFRSSSERELDARRRQTRDQLQAEIVTAIESGTEMDARALLKAIEQAERAGISNGLLDVCRAECLLGSSGSTRDWEDARKFAFSERPVAANYVPYQQYVRALVAWSDPSGSGHDDAAAALQQIFQAADLPAWLTTFRQQRGGRILVDAAVRLRRPLDTAPLEKLLDSPYADAESATKAYHWLALSRRLDGTSTDDRVVPNLALAAWYQEQPDRELAGRLIDTVMTELAAAGPPGRDRVPLLYVHAQSAGADPQRQLAALGSYARMVHLAEDEPKLASAAVPPLVLYAKLLAPAVKIADGLTAAALPPPLRLDVAALYATKGRLLREYPYESWPFDDVDQERFAAFDRAVAFDDSRAEYHFGRGDARLRLDDPALAEARQDAAAAIQRRDDFAGGHGLLGEVLLREARQIPDLAERPARLKEAVAALDQAVVHCEAEDKERAHYLTNRSMARLEWANYSRDGTRAVLEELFTRARDDAKQAVALRSAYQDYAYRALGNALEDLAWIVGHTDNYPEAVAAFSSAIQQRGDLAVAWLDRGRCHFKWVRYGGGAAALIDDAIRDLKAAIARDPKLAEPHYWLGRAHQQQGDLLAADQSFRAALQFDPELYLAARERAALALSRKDYVTADQMMQQALAAARAPVPHVWREYVEAWARSIEPFAEPVVPPSLKARLPILEAVAQQLAEDPTPAAAIFVGKVRTLQERWDAAIAAYSNGLGQKGTGPDLEAALYLNRAAARYVASQTRAKSSPPEQAQIVDDAHRAAGIAKDPSVRAEAHALAAVAQLRSADATTAKQAAVTDLRRAIESAPQHAQSWFWRFALVQTWVAVEPGLKADPAKRKEAIQYLNDAYQMAPPDLKIRIGRLRADL